MRKRNKWLSVISFLIVCIELIEGVFCNMLHLTAYAINTNNSIIYCSKDIDYIYQ